MYPVSELYKNKIKELERTFETKIQIQHSLGVLNLTDKDIVSGSLVYTESSQASEDFTIGGTVASDIEFSILNKPEYADIEFMGATVLVSIGLELIEGNDVWEYVPLGVFNIDDVNKQRNTIQIKAIDNMINLDKPYSLSQLGYPATLFQIYVDLCNVCDVMPGTVDFPNKNYVVQERPVGDYTCRDILGYIAELSGTFARMNRHGALELTWYKPTGLILAPANRFNFRPRDDKIRITGVIATVDDTTYIAGTDEYVVDLSENPLLQGDYETALPNIYNNIKDTEFTPFESNWQGNPAIQAGDMITQIDRDGKVYPTLVTSSTYKYRGSSTLKAEGLPMAAKGYKGSTNKKITNIIRKEIKPISDQLTTLEQAQLHATQLIANMLGGYAIQTPEAFYVADNPDLQQAQKVWKFGLGGFGYSENGVDRPYTTAITADGSIVAMLIAAGIVTADMIKTGQLRSVDGSTRINLDDGSFNFKNVMKYIDGTLSFNSIFGNGLMEINDDKGFVAYKDAAKQEYTQLYPGGLYRVFIDGVTEIKKEYFYERYLAIVGDYTQQTISFRPADHPTPSLWHDNVWEATNPPFYEVQLPSVFIGKDFRLNAEIYLGDGIYIDRYITKSLDMPGVNSKILMEIRDAPQNVVAQPGTTTTNVRYNNHGLRVGDWVYNNSIVLSPDDPYNNTAARVTSVVDNNNVTIEPIPNQVAGHNLSFIRVWDGLTSETMPAGIKNTGKFYAGGYFRYSWATMDSSYRITLYKYFSNFKVKIDAVI